MYSVYTMQRMQVYIPEELFSSLKQKATVEDVSMSELIRAGLKKILKVREKKVDPMTEFVGQYKAKEKTDAVKEINRYYQSQ